MQEPFNLYMLTRITYENYSKLLENSIYLLKETEFNNIITLINYLSNSFNDFQIKELDGFYTSVKLPQFSQEFDLIKYSDDTVLNIELKDQLPKGGFKSVLKQLVDKKFYLNKIFKDCIEIVYIVDSNQLFKLNKNSKLQEINIKELRNDLNLNNTNPESISQLFQPSRFSISPFKDPCKFLNNQYILTNSQKDHRDNIIKELNSGIKSINLTGVSGSGKTLILLDIMKNLSKEKNCLYIYCIQKIEDYENLNFANFKAISIKDSKNLTEEEFKSYHLIAIDEAHRLYDSDFNRIKLLSKNIPIIFSFDNYQMLSYKEHRVNISKEFKKLTSNKTHNLKETVRTHPVIYKFIENIFNQEKQALSIEELIEINRRVTIQYSNDEQETKLIIKYYNDVGFQFINYPKEKYQYEFSKYNNFKYIDFNEEKETHNVIGKDFPKICVLIDENFCIENNVINSNSYKSNPNYMLHKCLYQNITRTQDELVIIIQNNIECYLFIEKLLKVN